MSLSVSHQLSCLAARAALACTAGQILVLRVELNTPLHSLISVKEALFWTDTGRSPYTSSLFHGPPLLLSLLRLSSAHHALHLTALAMIDWITAHVLAKIAAKVDQQDEAKPAGEPD